MTVELSGRLTEAIRQHARVARPEEACGILVGRLDVGLVRVRHALPCVNRAPAEERTRRFEIDPRAVLNLQRALRETTQAIVGFYHSHPGSAPEPSRTDLQYLRLWPETVWLIAGVEDGCEGRLRAWWLDAHRAAAEDGAGPEAPHAAGGARRAGPYAAARSVGADLGARRAGADVGARRVGTHVGAASGGRMDARPDPYGGPGSSWASADPSAAHDPSEILSLRELAIANLHHAPAGGCPE